MHLCMMYPAGYPRDQRSTINGTVPNHVAALIAPAAHCHLSLLYPTGSSPSFCDLAAGSVLQDDWPAVWAAAGGTWQVPRVAGLEAWLSDTSSGTRLLQSLAVW